MNFDFSPEQNILRDMLGSYLAERWSHSNRVLALRQGIGGPTPLWRGLIEDLDLLGAAFPVDVGGLGGGAVETMLIMEQLGRALVVDPYVSTAVIAGDILKRCGGNTNALISDIIAGHMIVALAHHEGSTRFSLGRVDTKAVSTGEGYRISGRKAVVLGGPAATHFLVTARTDEGIGLFLIPAAGDGIEREDYSAIDGQRASNIDLHEAPALCLLGREGQGTLLLEPAIDAAVVALGAEAMGIMRELIDRTVEYMRQRKQFGQPLTSFQALQHRLADMAIEYEQAVSMVYMATLSLEECDADKRKAAASAMKIQVSRALRFISQQAVQLHGGMGMTDELPIGHFFKRAIVIMASFGSDDDHYRRYDALALQGTAASCAS